CTEHACHIPRVHDRALSRLEESTVQRGRAVRISPRSVEVGDLEVAQHPLGLLTTATEAPMTGDDEPAIHCHRCSPTWHCCASDDGVGAALEDLLHAIIRQAECR